MIDIAQVQGQVHAQSVQKVGELADKNPRNRLHHPSMAAREPQPPGVNEPDAPKRTAMRQTRSNGGAGELASAKQNGPETIGPERAAVLMLALGEEYGGKIWNLLDDDDLRQISVVMSTLGTVHPNRSRRCFSISSAACRLPAH